MADTTKLIAGLVSIHHDARVQEMRRLGRRAIDDANARSEIDALEKSSDAFERMLAVWTCFGSKDGGRVLRALHDSSARVRRLAFRLVPIVADDLQAMDALQLAFGMRQDHRVLAMLHAKGRQDVVDRYIDWLSGKADIHDFADVVPFGSDATLRKHLPRALARPSETFWERLARHAPRILGEVLIERISAAPGESDPITRQLMIKFELRLAEMAPGEALRIAHLYADRHIELSSSFFLNLWKNRTDDVLTFFETRKQPMPLYLSLKLPRAKASNHATLARMVTLGVQLDFELKDIDEPRRRACANAWADVADRFPIAGDGHFLPWVDNSEKRDLAYDFWRAASMGTDGMISVNAVAKLPRILREREARRHIHEVIALHTRPLERLAYTRFLPWDEAKTALADLLGHPEGGNRGLALSHLLAVLRYRDEGTVTDADVDRALEMVTQRKNEQDPVRNYMLAAIANWPRGLLSKKHLTTIGQILRAALDASDLSPGTSWYGEALIVRNFRLDPEWAASWLETWLKERGQLVDPRLGKHLTADEIKTTAPIITRIANAWLQQERFPMILSLLQSLEEQVALMPEFQAIVERARDLCPWGGWCVAFSALMRKHDFARYEATLPAVTRKWLDKGWYSELTELAMKYDEGDTLHQDLVNALEQVVVRTGTQWQVPPAIAALRSRANKRFGDLLARMLKHEPSLAALQPVYMYLHRRRQDLLEPYLDGRPITGRFATGQTSWLLPFTKDFWRWNTSQATRFGKRHQSIVEHSERDTPTRLHSMTVIPELCWAPMKDLVELCNHDTPVIKEKAIRIVARCDQGQGIPMLLKCLEDERARIAIYGLRRALRGQTPSRTFGLLKDVPLKKVTVAKEVLRLLGELRSDEAYARLIELDKTELHRDVRIALLRALWDHLESEPTWAVFERAVVATDWVMASRLGDIPANRLTTTSDGRLSKLLARVVSRKEPEARLDLLNRAAMLAIRDPERAFLAACRARILSPYDDEVNAAVGATLMRSDETDIPALKSTLDEVLKADLRTIVVATNRILAFGTSRWVFMLAAKAAEDVIAHDSRLAPLRVRALRGSRPSELHALLETFARDSTLSSDVLFEARTAVDAVTFDELDLLEPKLAESAHPELRRLAVHALVRQAARNRGWTEARLERLTKYRADASPIVAGAAHQVFPPREIVPTTSPPSP